MLIVFLCNLFVFFFFYSGWHGYDLWWVISVWSIAANWTLWTFQYVLQIDSPMATKGYRHRHPQQNCKDINFSFFQHSTYFFFFNFINFPLIYKLHDQIKQVTRLFEYYENSNFRWGIQKSNPFLVTWLLK